MGRARQKPTWAAITTAYTGLDQSLVTTIINCPKTLVANKPNPPSTANAAASQDPGTLDFAIDLAAWGKQVIEFKVNNTTATMSKATQVQDGGQDYQQKKMPPIKAIKTGLSQWSKSRPITLR